VLGYAAGTEIFANEVAKYNGSNAWEMTTKKYWADNTEYNFFAVWPTNGNNLVGATDFHSASLEFANTGEIDLVLAGRQVKTTEGQTGKDRGAAQLVFKHALSRVRFQFNNTYTTEGNGTQVYVDVTDLALVGEAKTGTVNITSTNNEENANTSTSVITWPTVAESGSDISYMIADEFTNTKIAQNSGATTAYKYIIPAKDKEYKLACKIKVYDQNNNTIRLFDYTGDKAITVKTTKTTLEHVAGLSYTYKMNIITNLNEITFTVDVEKWGTGNGDGEEIDFPGNN
jgi:hypothetical protein